MEKACRHLWFIMHPGRICLYHRSQMSFKYIYTCMHECLSAGCQEIVVIERNHGEYEQMCSIERAQLKIGRCCLEKVCMCQGWIISVVRQQVCRCAWKPQATLIFSWIRRMCPKLKEKTTNPFKYWLCYCNTWTCPLDASLLCFKGSTKSMPSIKTIFTVISNVRTCAGSAVKPGPRRDSPEARVHPLCSEERFQPCWEVADETDRNRSGLADFSLGEWLQDVPQPPRAARAVKGPHKSLIRMWVLQGWTGLPGHPEGCGLPEGEATAPATSVPAA